MFFFFLVLSLLFSWRHSVQEACQLSAETACLGRAEILLTSILLPLKFILNGDFIFKILM